MTQAYSAPGIDTVARTVGNYEIPRTWWGPVLAGAVSAIGLQFIFTVLGIAIGVTAAAPEAGEGVGADAGEARTIGMAAGAWWLLTGAVSLFGGGMVLGRLWYREPGCVLRLHAFALWAAVALFGFAVIWSGAGIASEASPLAGLSGDRGSMREGMGAGGTNSAGTTGTEASTEQVLKTTRNAAWWSVVGLLAGVGATLAGATIGAKASERRIATNA